MRIFKLSRTVLAIAIVGSAIAPAQAADAPYLTVDKLSPDSFQQKLQDTRENIGRQRLIRPDFVPAQTVIDVCKKNPRLPQCGL